MSVLTYIYLRPGPLPAETVRDFLDQAIGPWIEPDRYGTIEPTEAIPADVAGDPVGFLVKVYERAGLVIIGRGRTSLAIVPNRPGEHTFTRYAAWEGSARAAWLAREAHRDAVWAAMQTIGAPLAVAAASEAYNQFSMRWVPDEFGQIRVPTVPSYAHGLNHPHWRMWFGKEYRDFIGPDVLAAAPTTADRDFGDGYFVELHPEPGQWDEPSGREAAAAFAEAVGKRVFYDPADPDADLESPDFDHLLPG